MTILKMTDIDLKNKRVVIREDFNVPIENGRITSDARIRAAIPTIEYALKQNAKIILMSHLGRPKEGEFDPALSLKPVAECLSNLLKKPVEFISDYSQHINLNNGEIVLLENTRFLVGEKNNDPALSKKLASLCDVLVMDAFATAHRAESSTCGIAEFAPVACAGLLLSAELEALEKALKNPEKPLIAIVGGSKVSTKLEVLESLIKKVDQLIVGGGIANTFLAAKRFPVGKSLCEFDLIETAKKLLMLAEKNHVSMPLPTDVVVANEFSNTAIATIKNISAVAPHPTPLPGKRGEGEYVVDTGNINNSKQDLKQNNHLIDNSEMILDIGPQTANHYANLLQKAKTILWNGPVGVFEFSQFENGTKTIAEAIAQSPAFSIAGGGDTLAAIEKFHVEDQISYISTGGGAFLEFVEGKELPVIKILQQKGMQHHD